MDMTHSNAFKSGGSLLERAAELYDFGSGLRIAPVELAPDSAADIAPAPVDAPRPQAERPSRRAEAASRPASRARLSSAGRFKGRLAALDRDRLQSLGFVLPDAPVTGLAEEFRLIKRQILAAAGGAGSSLLVASAHSGDGKTFCAINLALSLASESDVEVVLVDADSSKPETLSILGLDCDGPGFVDALGDESADVEDFLIRTDLGSLSLLSAGTYSNNVPELLAAERTRTVLDQLTADRRRIVLFDSPPLLAASSAAILSALVDQVMLVVRADRTSESDLREAVSLLSGCGNLRLLLNGAGFAANGRRFGSYYGYGQ